VNDPHRAAGSDVAILEETYKFLAQCYWIFPRSEILEPR
jgi:hypothetical protein